MSKIDISNICKTGICGTSSNELDLIYFEGCMQWDKFQKKNVNAYKGSLFTYRSRTTIMGNQIRTKLPKL